MFVSCLVAVHLKDVSGQSRAARRPYLTAICLALAASFVAESASHLLVLADHRFQGLQIDKPDHALIDIDQPL